MRLMPLTSLAMVLAISGTSFAQGWNEFSSVEDGFSITFPGEPKISHTTWESQHGAILPARVYSGTQGTGKYTVTVVDYNPIERLLSERSRTLPALDLAVTVYGIGYWKNDVRSAVVYATTKYLERDVKITNMMANFQDLVAGMELQLTDNKDQSRSLFQSTCTTTVCYCGSRRAQELSPPLIFPGIAWMDR